MMQNMTKIEVAIERTKTELKKLKVEQTSIEAKIEVLEEQLDMLEYTDRNTVISHQE